MNSEPNVEQHNDITSPKKAQMAHDSMVTVRLSEPQLSINTKAQEQVLEEGDAQEVSSKSEKTDETNESPRITTQDPNGNEAVSPVSEDGDFRRGSDASDNSDDQVNWEELEKTEEQEPRDQGSDDVWSLPSYLYNQANNPVYGVTSSST